MANQRKKCLMLMSHYRPLIGGALTVYDALARYSGGSISILSASRNYVTGCEVEGWQDFDAEAPYRITRLPEMRTPIQKDKPGLLTRLYLSIREKNIENAIVAAVQRCVEQDEIDVICLCSFDANYALLPRLKKRTGKKTILYVHGEEVSQKAYSARAERRRRELLHAADAVVTVSHFTSNVMQEKYELSAEKIFVLTNGVDTRRFNGELHEGDRQKHNFPASPFVFASGRLVERKGFDRLLDAWPLVLKAVPSARLLIGGGGPLADALAAQVQLAGLSSSVELRGWLSDEAQRAAYGLADVFTMPNRDMPDGDTEGFGLVFVEAGAMGTTSVGGRAGGVVDAINDGETGLLVDGNKPEEIAKAIICLLTDRDYNRKLSQNAQIFARQNDWNIKAKAFQAFLARL